LGLKGPNAAGRLIALADRIELQPIDLAAGSRSRCGSSRRPDTIVGLGGTHIHAETATFELRASAVPNPRPGDQLSIGSDPFVIQGEPERRDPDRLVWSLDASSA
jgi:hypothetical protein